MFKKISESVPVLTMLLLALSIIKQILYYWNYKVPIKYFLGISELGLIISDELIFTLPILILVSYLNYFYLGLKRENKPAVSKIKYKIVLWISVSLYSVLLIIGLIKFISSESYSSKLIYSSLILLSSFPLYFLLIGSDIFLHFPTRDKFYSALIFIMVLSFIIGKTGYNLKKVDNGLYIGTKIITTDSIYTSTSTSYFIGKTTSFIFIYNKDSLTTNILPLESVKKIVLKIN